MRRVVLTPTFAAGLGVVVAAVLAYPMRTVFNYAAPGRSTCLQNTCGQPSPRSGQGSEEGNGVATPQAAAPGTTHSSAPSAEPSPYRSTTSSGGGNDNSSGGATPVASTPPDLSFQPAASREWGSGALITVTFRPGAMPARWRLLFGYPSADILKVWAGKLVRHHEHYVVITARDYRHEPLAYKHGLVIGIGVRGSAGPPPWCRFDGRPCQLIKRHVRK
jgi:hypothetical protein